MHKSKQALTVALAVRWVGIFSEMSTMVGTNALSSFCLMWVSTCPCRSDDEENRFWRRRTFLKINLASTIFIVRKKTARFRSSSRPISNVPKAPWGGKECRYFLTSKFQQFLVIFLNILHLLRLHFRYDVMAMRMACCERKTAIPYSLLYTIYHIMVCSMV